MVKCILPLARGGGYDKRSNATSFFSELAGKPVLGWLVDQVLPFDPVEVIFVLDSDDRRIIDYITNQYAFRSRFILQRKSKGSAHAIFGTKEFVDGEVVILFGDTFFQAPISRLPQLDADGAIWTYTVSDPRELGVVFTDDKGYATQLIEKPDEPVSDQAMIGLYYLKDAASLFDAIEYIMDNNITKRGFFTLADALQVMLNRGKRLLTREADSWIDADHGDGLFHLNALVLAKHAKKPSKFPNTVIVPPVSIGKDVLLRDAVVGPNVSVGAGASIVGSVVKDSVVGSGAKLSDSLLSFSDIGSGAVVRGKLRRLVLGDRSRVDLD